MKYLKIDPEEKLSSLSIFRVTGIAFALLSLTFASIIALSSSLVFDPTYEGFNFALFTVFKAPLAFLAAGLTILGIIALIHRSSQTTLQIKKSTEQNIFSNFYKHRQEYVDHFREIENDYPVHIKSNLSDKIIRGYYSSTFPENGPASFILKPRISWLEAFDKGLIELCFILSKMHGSTKQTIILSLYSEFLWQETTIRQGLFEINKPENAEIKLSNSKNIRIKYWDGRTANISCTENIIQSCFERVKQYADFIIKLKYFVDEYEVTMLYGTDVYSGFCTLEYHGDLDENDSPIKTLFKSHIEEIDMSESDSDELDEIFDEIRKLFDRKIDDLRKIK